MTDIKFPLEKKDIHYDPSTQDVSMKREKFDAFVKYVEELQEKLESTKDAADFERFDARKAKDSSNLLRDLVEYVEEGTVAIREWLSSDGHSISELSRRTGISYATCHRIVTERLEGPSMGVGQLTEMVAAVLPDRKAATPAHHAYGQVRSVLLGLGTKSSEGNLVLTLENTGTKVATARGGKEVARMAEELHPDLIMLEMSMPSANKIDLEALRKFAKDGKKTIILTGDPLIANTELFGGFFVK